MPREVFVERTWLSQDLQKFSSSAQYFAGDTSYTLTEHHQKWKAVAEKLAEEVSAYSSQIGESKALAELEALKREEKGGL